MEGGSVYVRERGKLRRVGGLAPGAATPPGDRRTDSRARVLSHAGGSLRFSASLFQMTLSFVVENIQHVESLVGFPEQIGRTVFSAAADRGAFSGPGSCTALRLFAHAYGERLLGSLCLRHRFPLLHERLEEIRTFCGLKSLDLFGCRLGDHHVIFQHVTSASLSNSLVRLSIGANGLSDAGLQRLTAPVRIRRTGLDGLQVLDVSYNPISERALRYLSCLPRLSQLDLSGTGMMISAGLQETAWELLGLRHCRQPLDLFPHPGCRTHGWAEQVVDQWESIGSEAPAPRTVEASRTAALCFYGRQRRIREAASSSGPADGGVAAASREALQFYRPTPAGGQPPPFPAKPRPGERKRKQDPGERGPPRKRGPPSAPTAEDLDLLSSY